MLKLLGNGEFNHLSMILTEGKGEPSRSLILASLFTAAWNIKGKEGAKLLSEYHASSQNLILCPSFNPKPTSLVKESILF